MPKLDLLCATIWGSGVIPRFWWGSGGLRGTPGGSGDSEMFQGILVGFQGVPGDSGVFRGSRDSGGVPGSSGGFRVGFGFYRHPTLGCDLPKCFKKEFVWTELNKNVLAQLSLLEE